jgi:phage recombination protein Bet
MNDLKTLDDYDNVYATLKNAIYPDITDDSLKIIIAYCKAKKYDPLSRPLEVIKHAERERVIKSIGGYRIDAARTGLYCGTDAPEFGQTILEKLGTKTVQYPEFCKVTVRKYITISNTIASFTAVEYWKENYKTLRDGTPTSMWLKRAFGMLYKCTEAQALRRAFPEDCGGTPAAEEMDGAIIDMQSVNALESNITLRDDDEIAELAKLIKETDTNTEDFLTHYKVSNIKCLTFDQFIDAKNLLQKKLSIINTAKKDEINE